MDDEDAACFQFWCLRNLYGFDVALTVSQRANELCDSAHLQYGHAWKIAAAEFRDAGFDIAWKVSATVAIRDDEDSRERERLADSA